MKIMRCLPFIFFLTGTIFFPSGFAQEAAPDKPVSTVVSKGIIRGAINDIKFSPDGKLLAVATWEGTRIYDVVTQHEVAHFTDHEGPVNTVAFSPNGIYLASGGDDKMIYIWEVTTKRRVDSLEEHTSGVRALAFNSKEFTLNNELTSIGDNIFIKWNANDSKRVKGYNTNRIVDTPIIDINGKNVGHKKAIFTALGLSLNGELIATTRALKVEKNGSDPYYENIEIRLGFSRFISTKHTNLINTLAFSPDGKILASGSTDKTICLHDINTGELLHRFEGHEDSITALTYHPIGGILLVSGSKDGTIRIWDPWTWKPSNKKPLHIYKEHTREVTALAFSPDGTLASGSKDGTVLIW